MPFIIDDSFSFWNLASGYAYETNTKILLFLLQNREAYPRELGRIFGLNYNTIYKGISNLENAGILRSYYKGRTHLYRFNPKCYFLPELKALLKKLYKKLPQKEKDKYYENKREKEDD